MLTLGWQGDQVLPWRSCLPDPQDPDPGGDPPLGGGGGAVLPH